MPETDHRVIHRTCAVGVATLLALAAATPALASRAARPAQLRALTQAAHGSTVGGLNRLPRSHYRVSGMRVSTVSDSWATARVVATPRYRDSLQSATIIAVAPAGTKGWVVVDLGSADVGCGIAPDRVLADLFATKPADVCPSGDGID